MLVSFFCVSVSEWVGRVAAFVLLVDHDVVVVDFAAATTSYRSGMSPRNAKVIVLCAQLVFFHSYLYFLVSYRYGSMNLNVWTLAHAKGHTIPRVTTNLFCFT